MEGVGGTEEFLEGVAGGVGLGVAEGGEFDAVVGGRLMDFAGFFGVVSTSLEALKGNGGTYCFLRIGRDG